MEVRFPHQLALLKPKAHLDQSPVGLPMVTHQKQRHQQSSLDQEMITINLGPSPCLLLTLKTSLGGHSFYLLKKWGETQSQGNQKGCGNN